VAAKHANTLITAHNVPYLGQMKEPADSKNQPFLAIYLLKTAF